MLLFFFFFFNDPATTEIYTLSLHDALPISIMKEIEATVGEYLVDVPNFRTDDKERSEEHTSELQSRRDLVCRLLLEKKKTFSERRGVHPPLEKTTSICSKIDDS